MAKSKWEKLKGRLDPLPGENDGDPKYMERIDNLKAAFNSLEPPELFSTLEAMNKRYDELQLELKDLNVEYEAINKVITDFLEANGVTSMRAKSGTLIYTQIEPHTTVTDREVINQWIDEHPDYRYLRSVIWQSLNMLVKSKLEAGKDDEVPPGVTVFLKTSVRCRK